MNIDQIRACRQFLADNSAAYAGMTDEQIRSALIAETNQVIESKTVTPVGIMSLAAPADLPDIAALLDVIEGMMATDPVVKWALSSFNTRGVDLGDMKVRAQLDQIASAVPTHAAAVAKLKALVEKNESIASQKGWQSLYTDAGPQYIARARAGE